MRLASGKLHPRAIAGPKAKVGDALVWTGTQWKAGTPSGGASVTVDATAPASPATGDLWYDTDATC